MITAIEIEMAERSGREEAEAFGQKRARLEALQRQAWLLGYEAAKEDEFAARCVWLLGGAGSVGAFWFFASLVS